MRQLLKLAAELLLARAVRQRRQDVARLARLTAGYCAAGICIAAALGCGLTAIWIYASQQLGPAAGPLAAGGVLLVLAAIVLAVTLRTPRRQPPPQDNLAAALLIGEATRFLQTHKASVVTAAVIAALAAGSRRG